ncbi:hypothetical protein C8J57DRAFT_1351948, partial [Mycena rebaudengoi]
MHERPSCPRVSASKSTHAVRRWMRAEGRARGRREVRARTRRERRLEQGISDGGLNGRWRREVVRNGRGGAGAETRDETRGLPATAPIIRSCRVIPQKAEHDGKKDERGKKKLGSSANERLKTVGKRVSARPSAVPPRLCTHRREPQLLDLMQEVQADVGYRARCKRGGCTTSLPSLQRNTLPRRLPRYGIRILSRQRTIRTSGSMHLCPTTPAPSEDVKITPS